jgi:hypothetical protein
MSGLLELLNLQSQTSPPRNELSHIYSSERQIGMLRWRDRDVAIGCLIDGFHCERLKAGLVMTMVSATFGRAPGDRSLSRAEQQEAINRDFMTLVDERLRLQVTGVVAFQSSDVAKRAIILEDWLVKEAEAFVGRMAIDPLPAAVVESVGQSDINSMEGLGDGQQN